MTVEFYNEGLAPKGLCELINQVIPRSRNRFKVIFKNRVEKRGLSGCIWYMRPDRANWIKIYPTVIEFHGKSHRIKIKGTKSFNSWCSLLFVTLHEFGHQFNHIPHSARQYENDYKFHEYIEGFADRWAIKTMSQIRDDRLGQPKGRLTGYLGVVEYRLEKYADRDKKKDGFNGFTYRMMENVRARLVGGQYSVSHVAAILKVSPYSIKRASEVLGITRYYKDTAGRKHLFLNHGEMSKIAYYLRESGKRRYTEEEMRKRAMQESERKQKKWMMSQMMTGDFWVEPTEPGDILFPCLDEDEIPF